MGRQKKIKEVKIKKLRKVTKKQSKRFKNSFLRKNEFYAFYFSETQSNGDCQVNGRLLDMNNEEYLIENTDYELIVPKRNIYKVEKEKLHDF